MRRLFLVLTASTLLGMHASQEAIAETTSSSSVHPVYRNRAYGYEVKLPPGLTYTRTTPPNPDHGIGIVLTDGARLWIDASYTDSSSSDEEADSQSKGCKVEERRPATLGNKTAIAIRFSCAGNAYGEAYSELLILTIHTEGDRSLVDYQIGLRANSGHGVSENVELFDKLVTGFSFRK